MDDQDKTVLFFGAMCFVAGVACGYLLTVLLALM
jgi:hypothetical protein